MLWGICGGSHLLLFLASAYNLRDSLVVRTGNMVRMFIGTITVSSLFLGVVGVLKVVDPETYLIGQNIIITLLFCFGTFAFWSGCIMFVKNLSEFYRRKVQMLYAEGGRRTLAFPMRFVFVCNALGCLSPLGCLVAPDVCTVFALSHYFLLAFIIVALGLYWNRSFSTTFLNALVEVDEFAKKDGGAKSTGSGTDLARLIGWVRFLKDQTVQMAIGNFFIAVIMAWPFMLRKASYQLAIAWLSSIGVAFGGMSILNDSIRKQKSKSSSKSGSKQGDIGSSQRLESYTTTLASKEKAVVPRRESEDSQEV